MKFLKDIFTKFKKAWQSKNSDYKNVKMGGLFFLIFSFVLFLSSFLVNDNIVLRYIAKYLFLYLGVLCIVLSFTFLFLHWYVYNNTSVKGKSLDFIILFFFAFIGLFIIIAIPFTALLGIMDKIILYRAKKLDNFIKFIVIFGCDLIVIMILFFPTLLIAKYIVDFLIINTISGLNSFAIELFTVITLIKLEIDLFFRLILFITKLYRKNKNKKIINKEKKIYGSKSNQNVILTHYIKNKKEYLEKITENFEDSIENDIVYMRNTLKRIQLAFLIIFFVVLVFDFYPIEIKNEIFEFKSDVINVFTIYTLIMLYKDKGKEWI